MTNVGKIKDPNEKGAGFLWGIVALLLIAAVVIGYIVWNGQRHRADAVADVAFDITFNDGIVTLASPNAKPDAASVELFNDFSCPHCADLARDTSSDMKKAIENGDLIVNLRMLNFLDGQDISNNEGHSTKSLAAVLPLAKAGDAKAFWNLHDKLLLDQQRVYNNWTAEDFANQARTYGASDEEVSAIKTGDLAEAQKIAQANYDYLEKATGQVSTPRVLVDGKDIPDTELANWVAYVTNA
ncbi:MAG: thioredoxin domain-containing protein [Corynebacterium sp.]|nr:thioredoxin domain-containing protein [Corynebacterium sp.]